MKKGKKVKKIVLGILGFVIVCFGIIIYFAVKDLKQEEVLKQEIINYSNRNLAVDQFPVDVKTSGDYAYVEEAVKKYYKALSDNVKAINSYLNNDKLTKILSIPNLIADRPDFTMSRTTIKNTKRKLEKAIGNIDSLCDEKTIKNLIDKEKFDDDEYYYDLYLQIMYTEQDVKEFAQLKKEMETLSQNLNQYLDKVDEILKFLQENDKLIRYEQNGMYFNSDESLSTYKKLLSELDEAVSKIEVSNDSSSEITEF